MNADRRELEIHDSVRVVMCPPSRRRRVVADLRVGVDGVQRSVQPHGVLPGSGLQTREISGEVEPEQAIVGQMPVRYAHRHWGGGEKPLV